MKFYLIFAAMILSVVISIGILGSVPPVDRDSLTHHLYVPKLYLKHGGIYEIPAVEFSYFPMNLDMLYTAALYFGSDILPKYIHFAFALLTAWLIFRYLKCRLNSLYALYGVLLFLSIPIIIKLSITAYMDLGLIFFTLFSIVYLLKWVENNFQLKYLVISAIACGLGLGTKYNGLITLFLVILSIIGLHNLFGLIREFTPNRGRMWIQSGVWAGLLALYPAGYLIDQFDKVKAVPYISGNIDRDSYITQFRPEYSAIRFANQNLPDTVKILAIFLGNRGYYFDRDVLFDMKLPIPANDTDGSGRTVKALLLQKGITHLLIRYDLFDRWLSTLTDNDKETLASFFQNRTRLLFASDGHGLFVIEE